MFTKPIRTEFEQLQEGFVQFPHFIDMISIAERHKIIKEQLQVNGYVRVQDLAEQLGVTGATIRKDLRILESQNVLLRTHGSASPVKPHVMDISVGVKASQNREKKIQIAHAAQQLITPDDAVIIASGSTMTAFAEILTPTNMLNVVTPSLGIAMILNEKDDVRVMMLGGELDKKSLSVRSSYTEAGLVNVSCSKLFIGCDGINLDTGITCSNLAEARLTTSMMKSCTQTVVLADSTKFGRRGFGKIGNIDDIDIIVTDSGIPDNLRKKIEDLGVQIMIADE